MVNLTEIQDMQHLKSVKERPQHMMTRMFQDQIADHVYIKEHRYIYIQGHKKGNKSSLFCNYLFFPLLKTNLSQKEERPLSRTNLSQKEEQPLSHHSK